MKWAWRIGRFFGIDVSIHATFWLLLVFVGWSHWLQTQTAAGVIEGVAFVLTIFLCVLLHEYGHALTARRYGIGTKDIILLPIGGVARLEKIPDKPIQEFWVALAGPAVNVVIAAALLGWLMVSRTLAPAEQVTVTGGPFLERLLVTNVFLVVFNLLPAFPMDGGRVLRALLAMKLDYVRATRIAALLGQAVAVVFGIIGLFSNPLLILVAVFVWVGASQEAAAVQMRSAIGGVPVSLAMVREFRTLAPSDDLARAVQLILTGSQHDFPVVAGDQVTGILSRDALLLALAQQPQHTPVDRVMTREFVTADAQEPLEAAVQRLQGTPCHTMPVLHHGKLVGLITAENIGEFVMIQAALHQRGAQIVAQPPH